MSLAKKRILDILAYLGERETKARKRIGDDRILVSRAMADAMDCVEVSPDEDTLVRVHRTIPDAEPVGGERWQSAPGKRPEPGVDPDGLAYLAIWDAWASQRKAQIAEAAVFDTLFGHYKTLKLDGGAETLEIVCGFGWIAGPAGWRYPLFTQACEVVLVDGDASSIDIRLANAGVSVETGAMSEMFDVAMAERDINGAGDVFNLGSMSGLEPESFRQSMESILMRMDTALGVPATVGSQKTCQAGGREWRVDLEWSIFLRERPNDRVVRDLLALARAVEDAEDLPPAVLDLVSDDPVRPPLDRGLGMRGLEPIGGSERVAELYFPMPYNDEQADIVRKLQSQHGVVVQGPPGTGKSHTIANIISHYLAEGKSILVSAHMAGALEVIRKNLPPGLADLTGALLSSDADSLRAFDQSTRIIAERISSFDPERSALIQDELRKTIDRLHADIAEIDLEIARIAAVQTEKHQVDGALCDASDIAAAGVASADDKHAWLLADFPSLSAMDDSLESAMDGIRHALGKAHGASPEAIAAADPDILPDAATVQAYVLARNEIALVDGAINSGIVARVIGDRGRIQDILDLFKREEDTRTLAERLVADHPRWTPQALEVVASLSARGQRADPIRRAAESGLRAAENWRKAMQDTGMPWSGVWRTVEAGEALGRLVEGKRAFGLFASGVPAELKRAIENATVGGLQASSSQDWELVRRWRKANIELIQGARSWSLAAHGLGLPEIGVEAKADTIARMLADYSEILVSLDPDPALGRIAKAHHDCQKLMVSVFGRSGLDADAVSAAGSTAVRRDTFHEALSGAEQWLGRLEGGGEIASALAATLRDCEQVDDGLAALSRARTEIEHLYSLRGLTDDLPNLLDIVSSHGAGAIAAAIRTGDGFVPDYWRESWIIGRRQQLIGTLGRHDDLRLAFVRRREASAWLASAYRDLVVEKAWAGMAANSTPRTQQALRRYSSAVRSIGKGKGKRSGRLMAEARDAMRDAFCAIPCWIMPHGRVSESMPATLGLFDLAIIDEASQSDVGALPAILRGKQVLVVGDNKQVSPSAVGAAGAEDRIVDLQRRFLGDQTKAAKANLAGGKSIYDLFSVVFAGNDVSLREHFRSVEPIISYSNRMHYDGMIIPLRVPRADQRIDPPLVDVRVVDGVRVGDENRAEAKAIVDEIEKLINDPAMSGRSIGVVTLTSNDRQAITINEMLIKTFSPDVLAERQLTAGPPPRFQGQERDIILISGVYGNGMRGGPTDREDIWQRINVAMSRARDRLYLFRSFDIDGVRDGSPLRRVLEHFLHREQDIAQSAPKGDLERDIANWLDDNGYGWRAHDSVGGGIDIVVEGQDGARLAIACDADGQDDAPWPVQMRRQRILERAGWVFWRVFANHYTADAAGVLADLAATLDRVGVRPGGKSGRGAICEHRSVNSGVVLPAVAAIPEILARPIEDDARLWSRDYTALSEKCDSEFEKSFLRALLDAGYAVAPQYPALGYRIDLLVQDAEGRRLAVELDGDHVHGIDALSDDAQRQAAIEAAEGLSFWRCYYSDYTDPEQDKVGELLRYLRQSGVQPVA